MPTFCSNWAQEQLYSCGKNRDAGDVWTWTALDADRKFMISWLVGDRTTHSADEFLKDLKSRLADRVHLSTDGHHVYNGAVERVFDGMVDYGQVQKTFGTAPGEITNDRYSNPKFSDCRKTVVNVTSSLKTGPL